MLRLCNKHAGLRAARGAGRGATSFAADIGEGDAGAACSPEAAGFAGAALPTQCCHGDPAVNRTALTLPSLSACPLCCRSIPGYAHPPHAPHPPPPLACPQTGAWDNQSLALPSQAPESWQQAGSAYSAMLAACLAGGCCHIGAALPPPPCPPAALLWREQCAGEAPHAAVPRPVRRHPDPQPTFRLAGRRGVCLPKYASRMHGGKVIGKHPGRD